MSSSQKERRAKFYQLDHLRKVEEIATSLRQYRGQSSKEYLRSLAAKYFIEYPNVKMRLIERLRTAEELKLVFTLNGNTLTKKFSFLSILEAFASSSPEYILTKQVATNNLLDFVEYLDDIEELAQQVKLEADEGTVPSKLKQLVLRGTIKDFYWGRDGRSLKENVNTVKKFYKISYVGFDELCHADKEIMVEYDQQRKRTDAQQPLADVCSGEFSDVLNGKRTALDQKEIQRVRADLLKKHYPQTFEQVRKELKPAERGKQETSLQTFVREWVDSIDLSLALFATKQKKFMESLSDTVKPAGQTTY